jgi:hypothetical protein
VIDYVRAQTRPGQPIFVMWAAANVYYGADRPPPVPYMWFRNIEAIPGALDKVHAALASDSRPSLVVAEQSADSLDTGGETARLLADHYHPVKRIGDVVIYRAN